MTDSPTLEATLSAWEDQLAILERQATAALKSARRLRKAAQEGTIASVPAAVAAMRQDAEKLADAVAIVEPPALDVADSFASGAYVEELAAAAKAADVRLIQRDGRITAFPVVVRLEPRTQGVRLGNKLEIRLRPSVLIGELKKLQSRPNRFNARSFLDRLLRAYAILAPHWQPAKTGEGPLIALADLHAVLTLWPQAAADYPVEEFLCDMLRLNRLPDSRTGRGHRFELGGSTGTKGDKRLSAFDETGAQHDFYAIRFAMD